MTGAEFLKRVRKLAKERGLSYSWHPHMGKGSHGVLKLADRPTVVRNLKDELKTGTLHTRSKTGGPGSDGTLSPTAACVGVGNR
jgi:mRNA interferase HicA